MPNKDKVKHSENVKRCFAKLKAKVIEKLGGRCSNPNCRWVNEDGSHGCTDSRILQVDHVKNDGNQERKKLSYTQIWRQALTDVEGRYQLLCNNCNWLKHVS